MARQEATSTLEVLNLDDPEKNPWSKARTNNKLNPHMAPGHHQTWATLVRSKHSCFLDPIL